MKNRKALIGVIVLVAICIAAYVGVTSVEKKVESAIREQLQALGVSAETVSYSLLSKKLELSGVKTAFTVLEQKQDYSLRHVLITEPNLEAFDPATPGRPLLAKSIVISGLEEKAEFINAGMPPMQSVATFENVSIENWRQNLGKIVQEYEKAPWSEGFFATLIDYSMDSLTYKNGKGQVKQGSIRSDFTLERMSGKNMHDDVFSLTAENMTLRTGEEKLRITGSIARFSITDMRLPSPLLMATVMECSPHLMKAQEVPHSLEVQAAVARLQPLAKAYLASTPYKNVTVEDMVLNTLSDGKEEKIFALKSYSNTLHFSFPYNFELGIRDLFVTDFFTLAAAQDMHDDEFDLSGLGIKDLTLSADFKLHSPAAPEVATLAIDLRIKDLAGLSGTFEAQLPLGGDLAKLLAIDPESWVASIALGKSLVAYSDDGLLARYLAFMSNEAEVAPAELLPDLNAQIQAQAAELPIPGLAAAAGEMLNKPGTMTLSMSPASPLPAPALLAALMMSPASVGLEVKTAPGVKSILEQVAALQIAAEAAENASEEASAPGTAPESVQGK